METNVIAKMKLFIEAILDDDQGITEEAYDLMMDFLYHHFSISPFPKEIELMMRCVKGCEGRRFLPEGWQNESTTT